MQKVHSYKKRSFLLLLLCATDFILSLTVLVHYRSIKVYRLSIKVNRSSIKSNMFRFTLKSKKSHSLVATNENSTDLFYLWLLRYINSPCL